MSDFWFQRINDQLTRMNAQLAGGRMTGAPSSGSGGGGSGGAPFNQNTLSVMDKLKYTSSALTQQFEAARNSVMRLSNSVAMLSGSNGFGFEYGLRTLDQFNRTLLSVSSQFSKYGVSITDVERKMQSLSSVTGMTREATLRLMGDFEHGFRFTSLENGEKLFKNIVVAVGKNEEAIRQMQQALSGLAQKFPALESSILRMDQYDKQRLRTQADLLLTTGKISLAEARRLKDYADGNRQAKTEDDERKKAAEAQIDAFNKMRQVFEQINLQIGKVMIPYLQKMADWVQTNVDKFEKWIGPVTKLILAFKTMQVIQGGIGSATSTISGIASAWMTKGGGATGSGATSTGATIMAAGSAVSNMLKGAGYGYMAGQGIDAGLEHFTGKKASQSGIGTQSASLAGQSLVGLATGGPFGLIAAGVGGITKMVMDIRNDIKSIYGSLPKAKSDEALKQIYGGAAKTSREQQMQLAAMGDTAGANAVAKLAAQQDKLAAAQVARDKAVQDKESFLKTASVGIRGGMDDEKLKKFEDQIEAAQKSVTSLSVEMHKAAVAAQPFTNKVEEFNNKANGANAFRRALGASEAGIDENIGKQIKASAATNAWADPAVLNKMLSPENMAAVQNKLASSMVQNVAGTSLSDISKRSNSDSVRKALGADYASLTSANSVAATDKNLAKYNQVSERLATEIENLKKQIAEAPDADNSGREQEIKNLKAAKSEVDLQSSRIYSRNYAISGNVREAQSVRDEQTDMRRQQLQVQNELVASQASLFDSLIAKASMTGQVTADITKNYQETKTAIESQAASAQFLGEQAVRQARQAQEQNEAQIKAAQIAANKATDEASRNKELEKISKLKMENQMQEAVVREGQNKLDQIAVDKQKQIFELNQKILNVYQGRIALSQAEKSVMQAQASLGDSSGIGAAQGYANRLKVMESINQQVTVQREKLERINDLLKQPENKNNLQLIQEQKQVQSELVGLQKEQLDTIRSISSVNQLNLELTQAGVSQAEAMVSLADSAGLGIKASAEMRWRVVDALKEEQKVQQDIAAVALKQERDQRAALDKMKVSGKASAEEIAEAEGRVKAASTERIKAQTTLLQLQQKQNEAVRAMRDNYVSAIAAMTTGAGIFNKIVVSQEQNFGGFLATAKGATQSLTSGGIGMNGQQAGQTAVTRMKIGPDGRPIISGNDSNDAYMGAYNAGGALGGEANRLQAKMRKALLDGDTEGYRQAARAYNGKVNSMGGAAAGANPNFVGAHITNSATNTPSGGYGKVINDSGGKTGPSDVKLSNEDLLAEKIGKAVANALASYVSNARGNYPSGTTRVGPASRSVH